MRRSRFIALGVLVLGVSILVASADSAVPVRSRTAVVPPTVFVDPAGSDANQCTATAPCASFDHAYRVAKPGQVVQVAGGSYPAQRIGSDPSKAAATANVVFRPAPGASVVLADSVLTIAGAHVELHGISMDQTACVSTVIAPPCPDVVVASGAHDVVVDGFHASRFYITGASFVTIENSDFGPAYDFHGIIHADTAGNRPHDILLQNLTIHDHWNSSACQASAACIGAHHQGCGPTLNDAYNVVEDQIRWFNCEDLDQLIKPYQFANQNITIQNSSFGASNGYYSLDLSSNASLPNQGLHLINNVFAKGISVTRGVPYANSTLIGNTVQLGNALCSIFLSTGWMVQGNSMCG